MLPKVGSTVQLRTRLALEKFFSLYIETSCLVWFGINSMFSKVWRIASVEVVLHLTMSKCISISLYGLETLPLKKCQPAPWKG